MCNMKLQALKIPTRPEFQHESSTPADELSFISLFVVPKCYINKI
jgi:hypothetical protein